MRAYITVICLVLLFFAASEAKAQEPQAPYSDWFTWDRATGDWGGARTRLEDFGLEWALNYTGNLLSNPVGGMRQDTAYASSLYGSLTFDLEKIYDVHGLSFFVAGAVEQGRDLSADAIGNVFTVSEIFGGDAARLAQVYFEQSLYEDRLRFAVGRLSAGDDFAVVDSFAYYVNGAVNDNPSGIWINFPSFASTPDAQWGARVSVSPTDNVYFSAAAYNADPSVQDDDRHGLDFRFDPEDGVLYLAELGISTNQDSSSSDLPGRYILGTIYDTSTYYFLASPNRVKSGNLGFYGIAEQMVYREDGKKGLTLWASVTVVPDQDINLVPLGLFGGAYYQGLFPGRDNDVTAMAVYYGALSDELPGKSAETVLELNHRFQVSPSTYITPDFQYIFNPGGGGIPDAAVFGFEASIDF